MKIDADIEKRCLLVDPFSGDFGYPGDKVLRDKMLTSRKPHVCGCCLDQIPSGERTRYLVGLYEGELHQYRFCWECCKAMAMSEHDNSDAWEKRASMGSSTGKF